MPVAYRKEIFTWQLVAKVEVSRSQNVTESLITHQIVLSRTLSCEGQVFEITIILANL